MFSKPVPAGMRSESPVQPPGVPMDIAMEDWDLLFDAVIARLLSSLEDMPSENAPPRRTAWVQTRARVMDCVHALDQLHLAASHELARRPPASTDGLPVTTPSSGCAASADPQPLPDDAIRAIWKVLHEHLCALAGLSLPSGKAASPHR